MALFTCGNEISLPVRVRDLAFREAGSPRLQPRAQAFVQKAGAPDTGVPWSNKPGQHNTEQVNITKLATSMNE